MSSATAVVVPSAAPPPPPSTSITTASSVVEIPDRANGGEPVAYHSTQQGLLNYKLRLDIDDQGAAVGGVHADIAQVLSDCQQRWAACLEAFNQSVALYETEAKFVGQTTIDRDALIKRAALSLPSIVFQKQYHITSTVADEEINKQHSAFAVRPTAVATALAPLSELQDKMTLLSRRDVIIDDIRTLADKLFPADRVMTSVPSDSQQQQQGASSSSSSSSKRAAEGDVTNSHPHGLDVLLQHTHQVLHADPLALLRVELTRTLAELTATESQIAMATEERDACIRSEDVAGAEERTRRTSVALCQLLLLIQKRFEEAKAAHSDLSEHAAHMKEFSAKADGLIASLMAEVTAKKTLAENDLAALATWSSEQDDADAVARAVAAEKQREYAAAIQQNAIETSRVWDEIQKLLPKLNALADTRKSLAQSHISAVDEERRRVAEYERSLAVRSHHRELLDRFDKDLSAATELLKSLGQFTHQAVTIVEKKDFPGKLDRVKLDEAVRFYNAYKRYAIVDNERLFRKNQRLENTRRTVRNVQFLIKHAAESLDVGIVEYREQLKRAMQTDAELSQEVKLINETIAQQKSLWDGGMSGYLDMSDVEYDPPELLVQQAQLQLMASLVESVDDAAAKEQRAVDQDKLTLRKMQNRCSATKTDLDARRQTKATVRNEAAADGAGGDRTPSK